jgi:hypothetical protein
MKRFLFVIVVLLICLVLTSRCSAQTITITVTLSGTPNSTTKLIPADLKYNKQGHFDWTQDDGGNGALDNSAVMYGGTAPTNGVTYPGYTFTDGANNRAKNIPYAGSVARNAWANSDTLSDYNALGPTYMTWPQIATVLNRGWSLLDHGAFHGIDQAGAVALGFNAFKNAAANRNYLYRKSLAEGVPYVTRYGVVPSADSGYHSAWEQMGYLGATSQNAFDNYPAEPQADWWNNGVGIVTNYKNDNRFHVQARRFKDLNASDAYSDYKTAIDVLLAQSSSSVHGSLSYGIHMNNVDTFNKVMNYLNTSASNRIWVCGLHEFYEYFNVIQQTKVTQSISGTTLTVTLDQSFLPDETRWRDMSFLLSSNVSISSVTVSGADDYSYNTSTGLINIYKKKTSGFSTPPYYNATGFTSGKVPLEDNDLFIDNNFGDYFDSTLGISVSKAMLVDGSTTNQYHARKFDGAMIYSPYEVVIDLSDYGVTVDSVRIYRSGNSGFTTKVIAVRNDNDAEDSLGVWSSGSGWLKITGRTASKRYVSSRIILRSTSTGGFGNEVEVYGTYLPYTEQTYPHRHPLLGQEAGTNTYVWDLIESGATSLNPNKASAFTSLGLRSSRFYVDSTFYSQNSGSVYSFDPIRINYHEDKMFRQIKAANPKLVRWNVLQGQTTSVKQSWQNAPTDVHQIKGKVVSYTDNGSFGTLVFSAFFSTGTTNVWWRLEGTATNGIPTVFPGFNPITVPTTFPSNVTIYIPAGMSSVYHVNDTVWARSIETSEINILHSKNNNTDRGTINTWDSVGREAYVYAARRGRNANATKFFPYAPGDYHDNNDSVGLGTAEWTEVMNEPNAWWAGYNDYLNGKFLALAWSKIYDNNKVYSTTLGAKNADTSMIISSSGLAINTVDLNRSAEITTRTLRGNRPKESVAMQPTYWKAKTFGWTNNPFEVIQFHNYAYTGGADQYGAGTHSGLPFEISPGYQAAKDFVWFRDKYAPWAKVDVGEWGYDLHQGSPMNAPAIGSYSIDQVRGIWAIRTMIEYNVIGIDYAQWYRLYSYDSTATQFSTMSLLRDDGSNNFSRRIIGNYFAQLSRYGDFVYDSTLRNDSLRVHRFKNGDTTVYKIWAVEKWNNPSNAGSVKATFTNRTGTYNLPLANGTAITVKNLQDNGTAMSSSNATVSGSSYPVSYDLKPVFIEVVNGAVLPGNNGGFKRKKGSRIKVKQSY